MSEHKWQPGDRCETHSGKPCRIAGYLNNGDLVWEYESAPGCWVVVWTSIYRKEAGLMPKPPTRKVVQWHYVHESSEVYGTDTPNKGRRVEWELLGDKIIGARLVEDEE